MIKDYEDIEEDKEVKFKQTNAYDPRVTAIIGVASIVIAGLATAAIVALFNLNSNVAVLLARPAGVSREEYVRDTIRRDQDYAEIKEEIRKLRDRK